MKVQPLGNSMEKTVNQETSFGSEDECLKESSTGIIQRNSRVRGASLHNVAALVGRGKNRGEQRNGESE